MGTRWYSVVVLMALSTTSRNSMTGEVNWVKDDGLNYSMTYYIAPKCSASFCRADNSFSNRSNSSVIIK